LEKTSGNLFLVFISAAGAGFCIFHLPGVIPFLLPGLILTLLYSLPLWPGKFIAALTQFGFMKTVLLALTWTYVTTALPVYNDFQISENFMLLLVARFSFMLMLCAIFDNRDKSIDKIHGLRSLATDVSPHVLRILVILMFVVFISSGFLLRSHLQDHQQLISFILTGIVVLLVYIISLRKRSYLFYYFIVDGLMLFSSATTYLATII
jgi:4-hydroxybenzoate polyprenyltransferase